MSEWIKEKIPAMNRHKEFLHKIEVSLLHRKLKGKEYPILGRTIKKYDDELLNKAIEISGSLSTTNMVRTFLAVCSSIANKEKANSILQSLSLRGIKK